MLLEHTTESTTQHVFTSPSHSNGTLALWLADLLVTKSTGKLPSERWQADERAALDHSNIELCCWT
jgi:hypothetical protein